MNISWGAGYLLVPLLVLVTFLTVLVVRRLLWQKKIVRALAAPEHEKKFVRNVSFVRKVTQVVCVGLGLFFLALALARPQWDVSESIIEQAGRDIIIALDISRSMLAQDSKPTRLEYAKEKIKKIVDALASDRIGLLVFAGDAFLLCPLTTDINAFLLFLDSVNHQTLSSGSTALDKAFGKAIDIFKTMPSRKTKLVIALTDGEDFSKNSTDLKKAAHEINLQIFTVGIGTQDGAPVPIVDKTGKIMDYEKDRSGAIILSRLNQELLQKISHETGAYYVQASSDDQDIAQLVKRVEKIEKEKFDEKKVDLKQERYYYFAALSLFLFIVDWIL